MEYTIQKLSNLAGVSTRTLRYYDEINLLKPARINSSGYRIYGQKEVDILQQILFYKELGVELTEIKEIITSPSFDSLTALKEHQKKLLIKQKQLNALIVNVNKTIEASERNYMITDKEKFEGFKKDLIENNEKQYGEEIREKYGEQQVEESNKKFMNMTKEQYEEFEKLSEEVISTLLEAMKTSDPSSETAQKAAKLHHKWLTYTWGSYSKEAHAGLANMYVNDERFKEYYDKHKPGLAEFLRDAVLIYTNLQ